MVKFSREVLSHHGGVMPTHYAWFRILKDTEASVDGRTLKQFKEGELHELPVGPSPRHDVGLVLVEQGAAEEVPAPEERNPPTLETVLAAGYSQEAAEGIVAEEARKFANGEKPYGDKEPTEPPEPAPPVETKAEAVEQPKEVIDEQPKEEPVEENKPEVVEQPKVELPESAQPKSKKK
jgi:hypothetical protein